MIMMIRRLGQVMGVSSSCYVKNAMGTQAAHMGPDTLGPAAAFQAAMGPMGCMPDIGCMPSSGMRA